MARINKQYHEDAKEQIIAAAIKVATDKGWDAVTLDAIARKIGVTIPALYCYFRNRDELQGVVVQRILQRNQDDLKEILSNEGNIQQIIQNYVNFVLIQKEKDKNDKLPSLLAARLLEDPKHHEIFARFYEGNLGLIRDCLARAQSRGEIPKQVDLDRASRLIIAIDMGLKVTSSFIKKTTMRAEKELYIDLIERILFLD